MKTQMRVIMRSDGDGTRFLIEEWRYTRRGTRRAREVEVENRITLSPKAARALGVELIEAVARCAARGEVR